MTCTVVSQLRHLLNVYLLLLMTFQYKVVQKNCCLEDCIESKQELCDIAGKLK